ncbi:bifunctional oligoribonuclease/PAP phosphatase NrnA [candidate division KSB1 bacterium]|nr:bifunctional oligoribonuclease/PAP phosphatase NrnA [candidate division KSB1 bacterium]
MIDQARWDEIKQVIDKNKIFILTTHINPDGDALGSEIAMAGYLQQRGKTVYIVNNSPTQNNYSFLDPRNHIIIFDADTHAPLIRQADVFIVVDISDWDRLKELGKQIQASLATTICIDHHHITEPFASIDIIREQASSTGELIYEFLNYVNCEFTPEICQALYTCILTDTGSFRFSNTTALTHAIAADLMERGVNARSIYQWVYERNSPTKIALMGRAITDFHYECNRKLVWFVLSRQMFKETNAHQWDTEGLPELPRTIDGVEVSLMFTELRDGKVKISLRSSGKIVIGDIAIKLGGGGHNFAAGALLNQTLDEAIPFVLDEVKRVIDGK